MAKAINLLFAAALAAAALFSAFSLTDLAEKSEKGDKRTCAERLCGVVFF